ncbi:hypothetical protein [Micavibrio aeruginosavorus]|uniref:Uncharacterized protein n=1 Tax=Micavibrio aeruginosavorus (strain ARL-13) TaxID=856793 RepID=G2KLC7_MICAA|nr:hypothetical protein [Micavibrio aeruginosavorus]AEP08363.1 hypothetical protein MICA_15 [Micavibrio aeruginosavorus ARL-13]
MVADSRTPPPRPRTAFADHVAQVQTDEKTIPTWNDDNIIVTLPPTDEEDLRTLESRIAGEKKAMVTANIVSITLPTSLLGAALYSAYETLTTPPANVQKQGAEPGPHYAESGLLFVAAALATALIGMMRKDSKKDLAALIAQRDAQNNNAPKLD